MQQIYRGPNLDAVRLLNFLAQHGIEARLQESSEDQRGPESQETTSCVSLWVDEAQAKAAESIREEFLTLADLARDDEQSSDEVGVDETENQPPARKSFPWLTIAFLLACLVLSIGLWRDGKSISLEALRRWGWRDSLAVADGSWWSVLTSHLLHHNPAHLVVNLLMLVPLSAGIERACGRLTWLGLLFSATLASSAAELAGRGEQGYGASGILFAFFGFALVVSFKIPLLSAWALVPIALWLIPSAVSDLTYAIAHLRTGKFDPSLHSFYSHLAGLAIGVLYGGTFAISRMQWLMRTAIATALVAAIIPLRGSPWLVNWHMARAERAITEHRAPEAIQHLTRAIEVDPQQAPAFLDRGFQFLLDGRLDEAASDFDRAATLDPKLEDIQAYRSLMLLLRSDVEGAYNLANESIRAGGAGAFGYATRGDLQLLMGKLDAAIRDLTVAIDLAPRETSFRIGRALAQSEQRNSNAAFSDADHACWLDPQDGSAFYSRGFCCLKLAREQKTREKAKEDFRRSRELLMEALKQYPRHLWNHIDLAQANCVIFQSDEDTQLLDEALISAEEAVSIAPRYWHAYSTRSTVQLARKEYKSAERDASRALELYPRDYISACLRGMAILKLDRPGDALKDFDQVIEINPKYDLARLGRGEARLELGQAGEAIDDLIWRLNSILKSLTPIDCVAGRAFQSANSMLEKPICRSRGFSRSTPPGVTKGALRTLIRDRRSARGCRGGPAAAIPSRSRDESPERRLYSRIPSGHAGTAGVLPAWAATREPHRQDS